VNGTDAQGYEPANNSGSKNLTDALRGQSKTQGNWGELSSKAF
jgi:DNA anti-recombination protein RmuC